MRHPSWKTSRRQLAQLFMGSRVNCAKCHNHPFENWTQDDYYSIAAVFVRVKHAGKTPIVSVADSGETKHPTSGRTLSPYGVEATADPKADRRVAFAAWLTKPGNPFFARVEVNRTWARLFGRGIVHPVDDFRSSNPPAIPELLDALARSSRSSLGFDRKHIVRLICNSQTYQRSTATNKFNEDDESLFSHYPIRRLTAEQLQDAIGYTTGSLPLPSDLPISLEKAEKGAAPPNDKGKQAALKKLRDRADYATQRLTPEQSQFLMAFGQPKRESPCACERIDEPTVDQALQLLNGQLVAGKLTAAASRYAKLADGELIDRLWLAAFSRLPSEAERKKATDHLKRGENRPDAVRDLVWAVMNTREFLLQH
ncbi:MAG: DUF1553 domain-containing protein [Gemmataceae bacterium]